MSMITSCSKSDNPVDEYVELINQATSKLEKIKNADDIQDLQDLYTNKKAVELEKEYGDYELTDKDKEKLKESLEKLIKVATDKSMEYAGFPEDLSQLKKAQMELLINQVNARIDVAKTLGEIEGL